MTAVTTSSTHLDEDNKDNKEQQMISSDGTCIVCFEKFIKDDIIVWSKDPNCSHIHHKECMVNYLASHAMHNVR